MFSVWECSFFSQLPKHIFRNLTVSVLRIYHCRVLGIHRFVCFIWTVCKSTENTVCTLLYCITTQCKHYRGSITHNNTHWKQCSGCDVFYLFMELYHTHTHTTIIVRHHVVELGRATGPHLHRRQYCPLPGNVGRTPWHGGSSLGRPPQARRHRPGP